MTTIPDINTAFPDGAAPAKSDLRDALNGLKERAGTLPADYTTYTGKQPPLVVKSDNTGPTVAGSGDVVNWNGAKTANQLARGFRYELVSVNITSGAVELDMDDGCVFLVTLDENVNADGITLANDPDNYSEITVKLLQDGTGGRTINSGSAVADAFPDADFYFPSAVTMPSGAGKYVVLAGFRFSSSDPYTMKLIHSES